MKIKTSKGKTFDVDFVCSPLSNPERIIIEMQNSRPFSEIASDFDGLESIREEDAERNPSVYKMYEGFSRLVEIHRYKADDGIRLTLAKE